MARCAREGCRCWRPDLVARLAGLGLYLDSRWYCSAGCLEAAARRRLSRPPDTLPPWTSSVPPLRLGVILVHQAGLQASVLKKALAQQARSGLRLGAQLVAMGAVSNLDVLRALAAQAGVGFLSVVDRRRLRPAPGNLSDDAIRALGLVPFEVNEAQQLLKVACPAPLPRVAISAMRHLTGYIIEPYLVADDQWPELLSAYGASRATEPPEQATVQDIEAAAARVALAAQTSGPLRMAEARCDDYVWVRLEGPGRTEDLWLPMAEGW